MDILEAGSKQTIKSLSSAEPSSVNQLEVELNEVNALITEMEQTPSAIKKFFGSDEFVGAAALLIITLAIDLIALYGFYFSLYFVPTALGVLAVMIVSYGAFKTENSRKTYIAALKVRKAVIEAQLKRPETLPAEKPVSNFDRVVNISIKNINVYYDQVKAHANKSFIASVTMAILGFFVVLAGLTLGYFVKPVDGNTSIQYVTIGAGAITEFISGVFFYLYNRTVRQMKDYHDSLVSVQNIVLALNLINEKYLDRKDMPGVITQAISFLLKKGKETASDDDETADT